MQAGRQGRLGLASHRMAFHSYDGALVLYGGHKEPSSSLR